MKDGILNIILLKSSFEASGDFSGMETSHTFNLSLPHWSNDIFSSQPIEKIIEYENKQYTFLKEVSLFNTITRYYVECQILRLDGAKQTDEPVKTLLTLRRTTNKEGVAARPIISFLFAVNHFARGIHDVDNKFTQEMKIYNYDFEERSDYILITDKGIHSKPKSLEDKDALAYEHVKKVFTEKYRQYLKETPAIRLYYVECPINVTPVPAPEPATPKVSMAEELIAGKSSSRTFATFNREEGLVRQLLESNTYDPSVVTSLRLLPKASWDQDSLSQTKRTLRVSVKVDKGNSWKTKLMPHTAAGYTKGKGVSSIVPVALSLSTLDGATSTPNWFLRFRKIETGVQETFLMPIDGMHPITYARTMDKYLAETIVHGVARNTMQALYTTEDLIESTLKALKSSRNNPLRMDVDNWHRINNRCLDLALNSRDAITAMLDLTSKFNFTDNLSCEPHLSVRSEPTRSILNGSWNSETTASADLSKDELKTLLTKKNAWNTMLERPRHKRSFLQADFKSYLELKEKDVKNMTFADFIKHFEKVHNLMDIVIGMFEDLQGSLVYVSIYGLDKGL